MMHFFLLVFIFLTPTTDHPSTFIVKALEAPSIAECKAAIPQVESVMQQAKGVSYVEVDCVGVNNPAEKVT